MVFLIAITFYYAFSLKKKKNPVTVKIPIGIPTNEEKAEIEVKLVIGKTEISECSM